MGRPSRARITRSRTTTIAPSATPKALRNFTRSWFGCDALAPLAEQNAKMAGEQSDLAGKSVLLLQPWEKRGWHRGLLDHERHVPGEENSADTVNRVPLRQTQASALLRSRCHSFDLYRPDLCDNVPAIGASNRGEAIHQLAGCQVADERSATLSARYQAHVLQPFERLSHRAGTDAELTRQVALVGESAAGLPRPRCDAIRHHIAQLKVKRPP